VNEWRCHVLPSSPAKARLHGLARLAGPKAMPRRNAGSNRGARDCSKGVARILHIPADGETRNRGVLIQSNNVARDSHNLFHFPWSQYRGASSPKSRIARIPHIRFRLRNSQQGGTPVQIMSPESFTIFSLSPCSVTGGLLPIPLVSPDSVSIFSLSPFFKKIQDLRAPPRE
jgi:hypothetical protein